MDINLFSPVYRVDECLEEIRQCLEAGWTGLGFKTAEFEQAWLEYTGLPHAHFLSSATGGLHLAVKILRQTDGWNDGDEVITTPLTFVSTNHAILYERLQPVFADVDEHLCLDPQAILDCITERTRAVMFVGLGGNAGRLNDVAAICRERGLRLILDGAHMSGTRLGGRHVGTEADVTVFSFHSVKNLPTADGGMICFQDAELDRLARKLSWLGISKDTYARWIGTEIYKWRYEVEHVGYKYHGNSVMAALGLVGLRYLDQDNAYRRQIASWYDSTLAKTGIPTVPVGPGCESSRHLYQILVENRDDVMLSLNEMHIYPGVHYKDNTSHPMYAQQPGDCPRAAAASERVLSLPMHLRLTFEDVKRVCDSLLAAVAVHKQEGVIR